MKKIYITLAVVIGVVLTVFQSFRFAGVSIDSWAGNMLGVLAFFIPFEMLMYFLNKDPDVKKPIRIICKVLFWFALVCYILSGVAEYFDVVEKNGKFTFF